jgi:hypothetical protein
MNSNNSLQVTAEKRQRLNSFENMTLQQKIENIAQLRDIERSGYYFDMQLHETIERQLNEHSI